MRQFFSGIHLKRVTENTFSQVLVKVITSSSNLFVTLLLTYSLGFYEFGSFTKIVTFVSFFYLLLDFGLNPIFLKTHFSNVETKLKDLLTARLFLSLILFLVVVLIGFFLPYNSLLNIGFAQTEKFGIALFALTLFPFGLNLSLQALIQRKLSYKILLTPNLIAYLVFLICILLGVILKNIAVIFVSYVLLYLVLFFLIKRTLHYSFPLVISPKSIYINTKKILLASYPLALILFFNVVYAKADTFLLSLSKSNVDVGIYGFSYRIFEFAIAIPTFFANSIYPILLEHHKKPEFTRFVRLYAYALFVISFIFVGVLIFGAPLLSILKPEFAYSVYPLQLLALSLPFFFLTSLLQWVLIVKDKKLILLSMYIFSMILNIFLNIVYIPQYSYIASAIITVVCEGIVFVLMILYFLFEKQKFFSRKS